MSDQTKETIDSATEHTAATELTLDRETLMDLNRENADVVRGGRAASNGCYSVSYIIVCVPC